MPAWPKLKLPLLADLAEQLRYAPKAAVVKDIQRTIETISLLQPATDYPADWIAFRITGYRSDQEFEPLAGSALMPQLAKLVELLSAQSKLTSDDLPTLGPGFDQPSLLKRWNISRKSLERYRTKGLVALRLLSPRGKSSLFFPAASTIAFESANSDALKRARAFTRIDEPSRSAIRARAEKLRSKAVITRTRLTSHLAKKTGRSRTAIERVLPPAKRTERRPRQTPKARLTLLAKWESGAGTGELARQSRKTRPAIVRALNLARQDRLERWDPSTRVPHDFPSDAPASLAAIATRHPRAEQAIHPPAEPGLESLLDSMRLPEVADRETERDFVLAHHACMRFASASRRLATDNLDLAETALRWAAKLRAALIRPHRRVIIESLDSHVGINLLRSEPTLLIAALAEAFRGASLAIELFTPETRSKREIGGSLAGPISLAVTRALTDWTKSAERDLRQLRIRHATRAARALGSVPDWTDYASSWQTALSPVRLRTQRDTVTPESAALLRLRFGWQSTRPHTVAEIAQTLRLTRIRAAAQLQFAIRAAPAT
ncbi:MAG: hypothetical protein ACREJD_14615 [Phycisphaerales bacterium]